MSQILEKYLDKFRRFPRQISSPPEPDLGIIVVIPCYNEPHLLTTLASLAQAQRPKCALEVIVVLNASSQAPTSHQTQNQQTLRDLEAWVTKHTGPGWRVHPLNFPALPHKQSGVGTARKIGMDEAVDRFAQLRREEGLVVCLDADCECDPNYFAALEEHFQQHPEHAGGAVYYEHSLEEAPSPAHRQAIAEYELHLRYYVHALRYAGLPMACHTVGSTMVARAKAYCQIGGMNRRKAGEDFYFMQKLAQTQNISDIVTTCVRPSPRISERVPFGTGKAVGDLLRQQEGPRWSTYAPQSFQDLLLLSTQAPQRYKNTQEEDIAWLAQLPLPLQEFLKQKEFLAKIQEVRQNTASPDSFRKRLFQWLNLFIAMKWVHFSRDHQAPNVSVKQAAAWLLTALDKAPEHHDTESLLSAYRALDRNSPFHIRHDQPSPY